ncbi:RHS repeat domain-containing protein, partial [Paenibacillus sp. IHBB 3054]|uniref:RHS repeat domain-containing protein n=1 Tax=Paenibacillus sp. IHBB 3054 TaxID=3425689 RepID=UPI003F67DE52
QMSSYGYDPLNRLVSITRPDGSRIAYTYDVRGNRQTLSDTSNGSPDTTDTSYTYDLQNTLTGVTKGGKATSFQYYADGMRYLKTNGNTQTQVNYNFQGQVISEEKIVSGVFVEQANFVRGDRVLVKKDKKASKDYYYLYNGHGDVVQIVNTSGEVVNNYTYDEWGNITSQVEGTSNSFKYTGEVYDTETGLYYLRARYYDPSIGRFINEDTYEGQIDNPLSLNLYTYVSNNPLIYTDPTGHFQTDDFWLLSSKNFDDIMFWSQAYKNAKKKGSESGMAFAHEQADLVRDQNLLEMADAVEAQIQQEIEEAYAVADMVIENMSIQVTKVIKQKGKYKDVGGHHVHAKAGFKGTTYDSKEGFAISQQFIKDNGWDHQSMTNEQRRLFKELKSSGRPNTMREHSRIAVEALMAGGATRLEARSFVAESLLNLRNQYVRNPSGIPWYK